MKNKEGTRIPNVTFRTREGGEWKDVTTDEIFAGKRVAVFALPGAFTPTCSASHLPRYEELAPAFRKAGIDEIVCISVNDGFVMEAWREDQDVKNVRMIPDGNAEFTSGMGALVDKSGLGFGGRSWRYSMVVKDGVIEKMFIEPEVEGDPYEVSDADTMYAYLAPEEAKKGSAVVFAKPGCPHCARAKRALTEAGLEYREIDIHGIGGMETVRAMTGAVTVPQVYIGGLRIGGADDVERYLKKNAKAA